MALLETCEKAGKNPLQKIEKNSPIFATMPATNLLNQIDI